MRIKTRLKRLEDKSKNTSLGIMIQIDENTVFYNEKYYNMDEFYNLFPSFKNSKWIEWC